MDPADTLQRREPMDTHVAPVLAGPPPSMPSFPILQEERTVADLCHQYAAAVATQEGAPDSVILGYILGAIHDQFMELEMASLDLLILLTQSLSGTNLQGAEKQNVIQLAKLKGVLAEMGSEGHQVKHLSTVRDISNGETPTKVITIPKEAPPRPDTPKAGSSPTPQSPLDDASAPQARVFRMVKEYRTGENLLEIITAIAQLNDEDLALLEGDAATTNNLMAIYREFMALVETTEAIPEQHADLFLAITDKMIHHPKCELLFPQGPQRTPGSFTFAATLLNKLLPLTEESAKKVALQPTIAKAYKNVWSEASMYIHYVFTHSILDMKHHHIDENKQQHLEEMQFGLRLLENFMPAHALLSKTQGSPFTISLGTMFALIRALDQADGIAEKDIAAYWGDANTFQDNCSEIAESLIPLSLPPADDPEALIEGIGRLLEDHQRAAFGGDQSKKTLTLVERANLFHRMRVARKINIEARKFANHIMRPEHNEVIRVVDLHTSTLVDISAHTKFIKDQKRYDATLKAIGSSLDFLKPTTPINAAERALLAIEETVNFRLSCRDPNAVHLKSTVSDIRSEYFALEYEKLRAKAIKYENHNYSQFNRPTMKREGTWYPEMQFNPRTMQEDIGASPVSGACSCNATMTLAYLLTPGRRKSDDMDFDLVMDEGQKLYYHILTNLYGEALEDTTGVYLEFENLNADVFSKGYLVPIERESREITQVLVPGQENAGYKLAWEQLEERIPESKTQIGGLIQNGASIYALHIEKKGDRTLYTIIDSHGLSHGIPTDDDNYDRAFRVTFESKDDAAMFLKLHHPYSSQDIRGHTCTVLPVVGPEKDLVVERDDGKGVMADARQYHTKVAALREAKRLEDRSLLRQNGLLPKTGKRFESRSRQGAPSITKQSRASDAKRSGKELLAELKMCKQADRIAEIAKALKGIAPSAQYLLDAYVAVWNENNPLLKKILTVSPTVKKTLVLSAEFKAKFKKAGTEEKKRMIARTWTDYRAQLLAKLDTIIK